MNPVGHKIIKRLLSITKILIGLFLLAALLVWDNNAQKLWDILVSMRVDYLFWLLLIGLWLNLISCLKWRLFLHEKQFNVTLSRLLKLYFVGKFFNNFIPSMVGGDIARIYLLGAQINSQSRSIASVVLERFTGLIALIVLVFVFSLINIEILKEPIIAIAIVGISLGVLVMAGFLLNGKLVNWARQRLTFNAFIGNILEKVQRIQNDILYFRGRYKLLSIAMAYSFAFHLGTSLNVYICCLSIGFHPSLLDIAVITPIILLLNILPVSPNNIGWWEWTFTIMLAEAGAGPAEGLAVSLILRAMSLVFSLAGGIIFLLERGSTIKTAGADDMVEKENRSV